MSEPTFPDQTWHHDVPLTMHLSIQGIGPDGCAETPEFEGDYLLTLSQQSPEFCRWELRIPHKCGLERVDLIARRDGSQGITIEVTFSGTVSGPRWRSDQVSDLREPLSLTLDPVTRRRAGMIWPEQTKATPLNVAIPTRGHVISSQPTAEELAALDQAGWAQQNVGSDPECPDCDPDDENCGCGDMPTGSWYASPGEANLAIHPGCPDTVLCEGVECTANCKVTIIGRRMVLTPPGVQSADGCTCWFYTTFKIRFRYSSISCPGSGSSAPECDSFSRYIHGGQLWPGRWIAPGLCLNTHADWYLNQCLECGEELTYEGWDMDAFLAQMEKVRPDCNGVLQDPPCDVRECPDPECP